MGSLTHCWLDIRLPSFLKVILQYQIKFKIYICFVLDNQLWRISGKYQEIKMHVSAHLPQSLRALYTGNQIRFCHQGEINYVTSILGNAAI